MGSHVASIGPSSGACWPLKAPFWAYLHHGGKNLVYSCHCVSIQTLVPFHFFFFMDPLTNCRGLGLYLLVPQTYGGGWLQNHDF